MHSLLVIALGESLLVGVYEYNKLIDKFEQKGYATELLPQIYEELRLKYSFSKLLYVNGPGSFMGIKISYIFLKTISIIEGMELFSRDGFYFNQNSPIKAYGKLYFIKDGENIVLKPHESVELHHFALPDELDIDIFSSNNLPYYGVDAV